MERQSDPVIGNGVRKPSIHLVRIPEKEARMRAIEALIDADEMWVMFAGNVMGISSRQLSVLQKHNVSFEWVSNTQADAPAV